MVRPVAVLVLLAAAPAGRADDRVEHFEKAVRPVLVERCFGCHSTAAGKSKGGLTLDSRDALVTGGESGPAVAAGRPAASLVVKAIRRADAAVSAMPPDEPLTPQQVSNIEKWITDGAVYPNGVAPAADTKAHWAFQPVKVVPPPTVARPDWVRTPADRFLLARLDAARLAPAADAPAHAVARRLTGVLTGLPPTAADLDAFVPAYAADPDAAVRRLADTLLASPHYGERRARHWMDVVRYADAAGHEYDYAIEGAWRYRDYLVRAFNADLPFDRFAAEHLAGDRLPPRVAGGRNEALLATAWWNLGPQATSPVDLANDEGDRMDDRLDALGKAFTGLTVGCARCHDHKFDPIPAREYYALFGVAASAPAYRAWANGPAIDAVAAKLRAVRDAAEVGPVEPVPATPLTLPAGAVDLTAGLPAGWHRDGHAEVVTPTTARRRGVPPGLWSGTRSRRLPANVRSPQFVIDRDYIDVLVAGEDATAQVVVGNLQAVRDPIYDGLRKRVKKGQWHWLRFSVGRWKGRRAHLEIVTGTMHGQSQILTTTDTPQSRFGLRAFARHDGPTPPTPAWDDLPTPATSDEAKTVEATIPRPEWFAGVFDAAGPPSPVFARGDATKPKGEPVPPRSPWAWHDPTSRYADRRQLAEAVIGPANPLTARVAINRLWQQVYGRGLVPTADNFGRLGDAPSHPELLDFLADRFVTVHRWSVKAMLRELVTAHAFRTASGPPPAADPTNVLLATYPMRRLDAEGVRDAILSAAGTLDGRSGGPPVPVPHALAGAGSDSGGNTPPSGPPDGNHRRSLYLGVWRNTPSAFLEAFDRPPPLGPFGRRDVTVSPAQALALLNDPFVVGQCEAWADRVRAGGLPPAESLAGMVRAAFARPPTPTEVDALTPLAVAGRWADVAMVLVNAKEFIHVP